MRLVTVELRPVSLSPISRERLAVTRAELTLLLLGLASLAIYSLAFIQPYGLLTWWFIPNLLISQTLRPSPHAGLLFGLAFAALFYIYVLACRTVRGHQETRLWTIAVLGAVAFAGLMLFLYPVGANDIFSYILRGRMQALYGANPYLQTPMAFSRDPFFPYSPFQDKAWAYGPLWELLASFAARLAGDGIVTNVLVFKALILAGYGGTAALIALATRRYAPDHALAGFLIFAWNPLVLYETAGNGHNDALMTLCIILGLILLRQRKFTLAALAMTVGSMIKYTPVLLVPIVLIMALKQLGDWSSRLRYLLVTSVSCSLLVGLLFAPFGYDKDLLAGRESVFTTSFPNLLQVSIAPFLGDHAANAFATDTALLLLAGWIVWEVWQIWRSKQEASAERAGLSIFLFFLLVSCQWVMAWYVMWPLAILALLYPPQRVLYYGTILLSYAVTWRLLVYEFILAPNGLWPVTNGLTHEWLATLGTLGLPWLFFGGYLAWRGIGFFRTWCSPPQRTILAIVPLVSLLTLVGILTIHPTPDPEPGKLSVYTTLGFSVRNSGDVYYLTRRAWAEGTRIEPVNSGEESYYQMALPGGTELWVAIDAHQEAQVLLPFFRTNRRTPLEVTDAIADPNQPLQGSFQVRPRSENGSGNCRPFIFSSPNYLTHVAQPFPRSVLANLTAFARDVQSFPYPAGLTENPTQASSFQPFFLPIGMFAKGGEPESKADVQFSGIVEDGGSISNPFTGRTFSWLAVRSQCVSIDVVADQRVLPSILEKGSRVAVNGWLLGDWQE